MRRVAFTWIDGLALTGLALVALGVGLVSVPAAFVIIGGALIAFAVLASRREVT